MSEVVIVRDPENEGRWHLRLVDDDDIGLTMCADGNGWKMKSWPYESEPLLFEMGCQDCMLMLAEFVKMDQENRHLEQHLLSVTKGGIQPLVRTSLNWQERGVAERLEKRGLLRKETVNLYRKGRRVVYYGTKKEQSV